MGESLAAERNAHGKPCRIGSSSLWAGSTVLRSSDTPFDISDEVLHAAVHSLKYSVSQRARNCCFSLEGCLSVVKMRFHGHCSGPRETSSHLMSSNKTPPCMSLT